jgi:hypothetical protein
MERIREARELVSPVPKGESVRPRSDLDENHEQGDEDDDGSDPAQPADLAAPAVLRWITRGIRVAISCTTRVAAVSSSPTGAAADALDADRDRTPQDWHRRSNGRSGDMNAGSPHAGHSVGDGCEGGWRRDPHDRQVPSARPITALQASQVSAIAPRDAMSPDGHCRSHRWTRPG